MKSFLLFLFGLNLFIGAASASSPMESISPAQKISLSAAGNSFAPAFSSDGQFLIFLSHANNLVASDNRLPFLDVFVRDLLSGENRLVSMNASGHGGGNRNSNFPAISSHGERIAFVSAASDLVTNDFNKENDVFVYDRLSGTTSLVSINHEGTASAVGPVGLPRFAAESGGPALSADGRWVLFQSGATNLVNLPDENGSDDIYIRDLETGTTRLVSVNEAGTAAATGPSTSPLLSADGRKVIFVSAAFDIASGVSNQVSAVFWRNLVTDAVTWVSRDLPFAQSVRCSNPVLSADGNVVVFLAEAVDRSMAWLCRRDLTSSTLSIVASNASAFVFPVLSASGQAIAFELVLDPAVPETRGIELWKWPGGPLELISGTNTVSGGSAVCPAISSDGRFVSYVADVPNESLTGIVTHVFLRDTLLQTTQRIDADAAGQPSRWSAAPAPAPFLPTGLQVAFASRADDLVSGDYNQASDLFLRDPVQGTTALLTVGHSALPNRAGALASSLLKYSLGLDGRSILFRSFSTNLASQPTSFNDFGTGRLLLYDRQAQTNLLIDPGMPALDAALSPDARSIVFSNSRGIWLRSLAGDTNQLLSVNYTDGLPATGTFQDPTMSLDSTLVAFVAAGSGLAPGSFGPTSIYLRNLALNSTLLVGGLGNSSSIIARTFNPPVLSSDGHWVVWGAAQNLFARNVQKTEILALSVHAGTSLTGDASAVTISGNSRQVAFVNNNNRIFVFDLATASNRLACTSCREPSLNRDGTLLALESWAGDGPRQIFLQTLSSGAMALISVNRSGSGGGNGPSRSPVISGNGRFVIFVSSASDLVPDDNNGQADLFLRDTVAQTTILLASGNEEYPFSSDLFRRPLISLNGETIAFQSFASGSNSQDFNGTGDIFTLELGSSDSDGDGLDDGWETAYFNGLQREGNGDFDHDGKTDREEFLAGTNPADTRGIVALTALLRIPDGSKILYWSSLPGRSYRVEMKSSTTASEWLAIAANIVATTVTASYHDAASDDPQRFYRIVLEP